MIADIYAPLFRYQCQVKRVIDGDTLDVMIDQGLHIYRNERIRLLNVDCPERNTVAGRAAWDFTSNWVGTVFDVERAADPFHSWPFAIQTFKADSFGRWLGIIARRFDGSILNQDLIDHGHFKVVGHA